MRILLVLILALCGQIMHASSDKLQLGQVHIFTKQNQINQQIELGYKFLHNFMYNQAEQEFKSALNKSNNPWALLGLLATYNHALWHFTDYDKAKKFLTQSKKQITDQSLVSQMLAAFVNLYEHKPEKFHAALVKLYSKFPDNPEVAAFYGLSLMSNRDDLAAARKVFNKALKLYPDHPGLLHYNIHAHDVDNNEIVKQALPMAEHYFKIAKNSSHGLHMPSHLYVRLGLWDQSIHANQDSIIASNKICKFYHQDPLCDYENKLHSTEWLHYSLLQHGKDKQAKQLFDSMKDFRNSEYIGVKNIYSLMLSRNLLYGLSQSEPLPKPLVTKTNYSYWSVYSEVSLLVAKGVTTSSSKLLQQLLLRLKKLQSMTAKNKPEMQSYIKLGIAQLNAANAVNKGDLKKAISILKSAQTFELDLFQSSAPPSLGYLTASETLWALYIKTNQQQKAAKIKAKFVFPNKRLAYLFSD